MPLGDLLRYPLLLLAARSFSALETSFTTIGSLIGTLETSVPDEIIVLPGKQGRSVTVHIHLNKAAKTARAEGRPCVTYITLHGTTPFHAHSKYLLA